MKKGCSKIRDVRSQSGALPKRSVLGALVFGLFTSGLAQAGTFQLDNGIEGTWGLNMSLGTSIRAKDADANLIMRGNGGNGGSSHDDGNLNFKKGDTFSTIAKVIGEVGLKKDNVGLFVRAKAWYDYQLSDRGVPFGSSANAYMAGAKLNDKDFDNLSQFSGARLLDAYVSWDTYVGSNHPLSFKLGNQVVNWGESLFIPGINQYGAFDISAARRPGGSAQGNPAADSAVVGKPWPDRQSEPRGFLSVQAFEKRA